MGTDTATTSSMNCARTDRRLKPHTSTPLFERPTVLQGIRIVHGVCGGGPRENGQKGYRARGAPPVEWDTKAARARMSASLSCSA